MCGLLRRRSSSSGLKGELNPQGRRENVELTRSQRHLDQQSRARVSQLLIVQETERSTVPFHYPTL